MRYALPLWHCLSDEARYKLGKMAGKSFTIPPCEWVKWPEFQIDTMPMDIRDIQEAREYYDKFMREKPHKPARVR